MSVFEYLLLNLTIFGRFEYSYRWCSSPWWHTDPASWHRTVHCTVGCIDFDCFSQIWNADTSHVFLRAQGLRIWRKNCFWFSHLLRIFSLPNLQWPFLLIFQKCTTKARINRFFSKFLRLFQRIFSDTSEKISSLPFKLRSPGRFPDWCPNKKNCKIVNDGFLVIKH